MLNRILQTLLILGLWLSTSNVIAKVSRVAPRQEPIPTWVTPLKFPSTLGQPTASGRAPTDLALLSGQPSVPGYLLYDQQERFSRTLPESFLHVAYVVEKPSDVQYGSELSVQYSPDFEELIVHYARIHRGRQVIDALAGAQIREVNPTTERDDFLYDESRNVVLLLKDVRSGDAIEWAYTIRGQNPAILGRTLAQSRLTRGSFVHEALVRWLLPDDSHAQLRVHGADAVPKRSVAGGGTEYVWTVNQARAVEEEGDEPSWYVPEPWVELSDYQSWSEVVQWALPLYPKAKVLSPDLRSLIERFAALPTASDKLLASARFVQDELRYLGLETGLHSLVPHSPNQTLERRFGDCKDKTYLLVTILNQLGLEAAPALVSSREGHLLKDRLPAPTVFDHVIAKVKLNGKVLWFDPTAASERSDLEAHRFTPYEQALVIAEGVNGLEAMVEQQPEEPLSEVEEHYELRGDSDPVVLTVKTTLRGSRADDYRSRAERYSLPGLMREYLNFFSKRYAGVEFVNPPVVQDDQEHDVIHTLEQYRLGALFLDGTVHLRAWSFDDILESPDMVLRRTPLGIPHPYWGEHRIVISYQSLPQLQLPSNQFSDHALKFSAKSEKFEAERRLAVTFSLKSQKAYVEAEGVVEHLLMRRRIDALREVVVSLPSRSPPPSREHSSRWTSSVVWLLAGGLGGLICGGALVWTGRRYRRLFGRRRRKGGLRAPVP